MLLLKYVISFWIQYLLSVTPIILGGQMQWQQMDIEYTFWQMLNLCTSPKVVWVSNTLQIILGVLHACLYSVNLIITSFSSYLSFT